MVEKIGIATLYLADCADALKEIRTESIDAVVTDPPYGLSFMSAKWDHAVPGPDVWRAVMATMKPGAHLLSFWGSRTYHRGTVSIEDAGLEVRDQIMWVYGQGFPKSHNISKAIDKAAGHWRGRAGEPTSGNGSMGGSNYARSDKGVPVTPEAAVWDGWGTALKPSHEPITVARKPFSGTVAANVLQHGTGAINIDDCRVETGDILPVFDRTGGETATRTWEMGTACQIGTSSQGRHPANLIHDGSDEVIAAFPITEPSRKSIVRGTTDAGRPSRCPGHKAGEFKLGHGDSGSAARFFYCAKASRRDRDSGLDDLPGPARQTMGSGIGGQPDQDRANNRNPHPTVKPTDLMAYLCRLITPPSGVVLDPFMGSGSTGVAAVREGFAFIGIERDPEYFEIACRRIAAEQGITYRDAP